VALERPELGAVLDEAGEILAVRFVINLSVHRDPPFQMTSANALSVTIVQLRAVFACTA
jgi:hypothetical protein